jgi:predicted esterase
MTGPGSVAARVVALAVLLLAVGSGCRESSLVDEVPDGGSDTGGDADTDTGSETDTSEELEIDTDQPDELGPSGEIVYPVEFGGMNRSFVIYVPESALAAMADGPVPALVGLHWAGGTGQNFIVQTGLNLTADDNAFVVIAPQGYAGGWFINTADGWPATDGNSTSLPSDVELVQRSLALTSHDYWIDVDRLYCAGHSRGAAFTGLLAVKSGNIELGSATWFSPFAAYGINAGYNATGGNPPLTDSEPKRPVWIIHGTGDTVVELYLGQEFADDLSASGWDVLFTAIDGAGHAWLWYPTYDYTAQDLWDWCLANGL